MTRNEVLHKVIEIINGFLPEDFPNVTENDRLAADLVLDSLDITEIAMSIQRRFDVCFDYGEWDKIKFSSVSVKEMVDFICKKLNIPVIDVQKKEAKPKQQIVVQNPEIEKLKNVDLSKLAGKTVELNGYKIVIEKIAQDTKVKGK